MEDISRSRIYKNVVRAVCLTIAFIYLDAAPLRAAGQMENNLPAQTRTVIERLDALSTLDAEGWKYHEGNIAHGEAVDLDDSAWTNVQQDVGGSWETSQAK